MRTNESNSWWSNPFVILVLSGFLVLSFQNCGEGAKVTDGSSSGRSILIEEDLAALIGEIRVAEGEVAQFVIQINQTVSYDVEFTYATDNGTAEAGVHYEETIGAGAIIAGETQTIVEVPTIGGQASDITDLDFNLVVVFTDPALNQNLAPGRAIFGIPPTVIVTNDSFQNSSHSGRLSTGSSHTCAINAQGVPFCWGRNAEGQLGNGNNTESLTPVMVAGMAAGGVSAISAGYRHTCAIRNGALFCWGNNTSAEIGDGTTTNRNFPTAVQFLGSGVKAVSAGRNHTCAIQTINGGDALLCWGLNDNAQVGHNNGNPQTVPFNVPNFQTGVSAVASGIQSTCAIRNGGMMCWGRNTEGQLGIGSAVNNLARNPSDQVLAPPLGLETGVTAIAMNGHTTCATRNGGLNCWGYNNFSNLGDGLTTNVVSPQPVGGFTTDVSHATTGSDHTCVIRSGGIYCWGNNNHGELGDGTTVNAITRPATPLAIALGAGEGFTTISAASGDNAVLGTTHTCAGTNLGRFFCWGNNNQGQIGDGTDLNKLVPTEINIP